MLAWPRCYSRHPKFLVVVRQRIACATHRMYNEYVVERHGQRAIQKAEGREGRRDEPANWNSSMMLNRCGLDSGTRNATRLPGGAVDNPLLSIEAMGSAECCIGLPGSGLRAIPMPGVLMLLLLPPRLRLSLGGERALGGDIRGLPLKPTDPGRAGSSKGIEVLERIARPERLTASSRWPKMRSFESCRVGECAIGRSMARESGDGERVRIDALDDEARLCRSGA